MIFKLCAMNSTRIVRKILQRIMVALNMVLGCLKRAARIQVKNLLHGLKLPEDTESLCRIRELGLSIHQCDSNVS